MAELAERWEAVNAPRQSKRTGDWIGWSPKTARTHLDNVRNHILPAIGDRPADAVTGLELDDLYCALEHETGLSPSAVARCHSQIRAMFNWALRKKLVAANPATAADPPQMKQATLQIPMMDDVRQVIAGSPPNFAAYLQLAATVGARRGTLVALRWGNIDLDEQRMTLERSIAQSSSGLIEKGTKADGPTASRSGSPPPACSPSTEPAARRRRSPSARRCRRTRSSSPMTVARRTGICRGPHTAGDASPPAPASPSSGCTTCDTPPPVRCSWPACPSRSSPNDSAAPKATSSRPTGTSFPGADREAAALMDAMLAGDVADSR